VRTRLLAALVSLVAKCLIRTLRYHRLGPPVEGPALVAFWHGEQLALLGQRPAGPLIAAISLSRDGDLQTAVMARFGVRAVRGSSSRGGPMALRGLLRSLRAGHTALMAVDGPRGPYGAVKPGIIYLAQRTGLPIYAASVAVGRGHRLMGAWDKFLLPWPWTRTVVCFGAPWRPSEGGSMDQHCAELGEMLREAGRQASSVLGLDENPIHIEAPSERT